MPANEKGGEKNMFLHQSNIVWFPWKQWQHKQGIPLLEIVKLIGRKTEIIITKSISKGDRSIPTREPKERRVKWESEEDEDAALKRKGKISS